MNAPLAIRSVLLVCSMAAPLVAQESPCVSHVKVAAVDAVVVDRGPSWIFRRGTFTHDPETGARVAQYERIPPVEPLDDERLVTSRHRRSRTNLRGIDGSIDTYYEVQSWGNGRGGLDAEWERFHDAWKESYLQGGFYNQGPWFSGYPGWGYGPFHPGHGAGGWGHGGGDPRYGAPGWVSGDPWYAFPPGDRVPPMGRGFPGGHHRPPFGRGGGGGAGGSEDANPAGPPSNE